MVLLTVLLPIHKDVCHALVSSIGLRRPGPLRLGVGLGCGLDVGRAADQYLVSSSWEGSYADIRDMGQGAVFLLPDSRPRLASFVQALPSAGADLLRKWNLCSSSQKPSGVACCQFCVHDWTFQCAWKSRIRGGFAAVRGGVGWEFKGSMGREMPCAEASAAASNASRLTRGGLKVVG